ncbi:hypothetical protein PIB30_018562 [Stylosanthes scabra]|uniref:Uncharacterized protein n=1 Tax=Stylosanthes scabra TaxID=79078 RepID=A0ABU6Q9H5_9FABA|nr:hypothetical protein [Stylosanthes scabra]
METETLVEEHNRHHHNHNRSPPRFGSRIPLIDRDTSISEENILQYTSLKDVICNSSPTKHYSTLFYGGNEALFDSNIAIRNELVKRAASVYLHSAAMLATRNHNCFEAFWERVKSKASSLSFWMMSSCMFPIFDFLDHIMGSLRPLP